MSNINLLPEEIKNEIAISKKNKVIFNILIFLIFLVLLLATFSFWGFGFLSDKALSLETTINKKETSLAGFGSLENDSKNFNERVLLYKKLEKENIYWSLAMKEIALKTPSNLYLLVVKASDDTKTRGSITGNANDKMAIATFINSLKESGTFKFIDVESVTRIQDPNTGEEKDNFTLSFTIEKGRLIR